MKQYITIVAFLTFATASAQQRIVVHHNSDVYDVVDSLRNEFKASVAARNKNVITILNNQIVNVKKDTLYAFQLHERTLGLFFSW